MKAYKSFLIKITLGCFIIAFINSNAIGAKIELDYSNGIGSSLKIKDNKTEKLINIYIHDKYVLGLNNFKPPVDIQFIKGKIGIGGSEQEAINNLSDIFIEKGIITTKQKNPFRGVTIFKFRIIEERINATPPSMPPTLPDDETLEKIFEGN